MFGQQTSSNGERLNMSFGVLFAIDILLLVVVYVVMNHFVISKQEKPEKMREKFTNWLLVGFFVLLVITLFLTVPPVDVLYSAILSLERVSILALATTGIVLIFRTSVTTNFSQGIVATLGSYFASVILARYLLDSGLSMGLVLFFFVLAGTIFSFIVGLLIDVIIIRNSNYRGDGCG
jgi:hypothetical protein